MSNKLDPFFVVPYNEKEDVLLRHPLFSFCRSAGSFFRDHCIVIRAYLWVLASWNERSRSRLHYHARVGTLKMTIGKEYIVILSIREASPFEARGCLQLHQRLHAAGSLRNVREASAGDDAGVQHFSVWYHWKFIYFQGVTPARLLKTSLTWVK